MQQYLYFHTKQMLIYVIGVFFFSGASGAAMAHWLTGVEELMVTTSRLLLPTPDVNISHYIMRQALEHEAGRQREK